MRWDRDDIIAVDHKRLAGFLPLLPSTFQHADKFFPALLCGMLSLKLTLSVPPPHNQNHGRDTRVDSSSITGERCAEAIPDEKNWGRPNLGSRTQPAYSR